MPPLIFMLCWGHWHKKYLNGPVETVSCPINSMVIFPSVMWLFTRGCHHSLRRMQELLEKEDEEAALYRGARGRSWSLGCALCIGSTFREFHIAIRHGPCMDSDDLAENCHVSINFPMVMLNYQRIPGGISHETSIFDWDFLQFCGPPETAGNQRQTHVGVYI